MTRTFTLGAPSGPAFPLDLDQGLNDAQRAAVTAGDGPKLVIAGAGSGKTRTITYRVAYLISRGAHPSQLLLATFTNKAAREMLSRVEALTGSEAAGIWGGTFHAIGNRLLRHYAELAGLRNNYSILDDEDQRDLIKVCVTETNVKVEEKRFPAPSILQDFISMAFNTQRSLSQVIEERAPHFAIWTPEVERIAARYEAKKRAANALDYDDLLRYWLTLVEERQDFAERLGRQFRHILVDEYQDTNRVQARIVERIAETNGRNLMVVGDDAQSIYRFRGAHYDNILRFPERNPGTEVFKLEVNYRSTPEILEFTNASIARNNRQHRKTLVAHRGRGSLPVVLPVNDAYQEAAFVAERLLQLRDDGVPLADMAVLYRAHAHSSILQAELIKRNIPYDVRSGVRFFEQAHIKDVVAFLKVLDNPFDEIAWRRLWLMLPKIGNVTAGRLWDAVARAADPLEAVLGAPMLERLPANGRPGFVRFQKELRGLKAVHDRPPDEIIRAVCDTAYGEFLKARYEDYQTRFEDLEQLAVFSKPYKTLSSLLSELILLGEIYGKNGSAADADTERLILSSVHQAKGLEWKVVFVIRMCEGNFPSEMALREEDGEEEERRIFYVAATRAKDELYLTHPLMDLSPRGNGGMLLEPSRFLREIRFTLYEQGEIEIAPRDTHWEDD
jgi:DNA helicase-2/ATP-dependent DNA helicase PcrA